MDSTKDIIEKAESLPVEERVLIIESLQRSLNAPESAVDKQWVAVAKGRLAEIRSGKTKPVPGKAVFASIRKRLGK